MARPPQPELARSAKTDLDPDHVDTGLPGRPPPSTGGETGPIPVDNQPGHHPAKEQDKPDLDAFAAKLGTASPAPSANRPVAAPDWPESAPAADDLGPLPDPAGDLRRAEGLEPRLVSLVLLPLRETVKRLEQLDRSLTERLTERVRSARGSRQ